MFSDWGDHSGALGDFQAHLSVFPVFCETYFCKLLIISGGCFGVQETIRRDLRLGMLYKGGMGNISIDTGAQARGPNRYKGYACYCVVPVIGGGDLIYLYAGAYTRANHYSRTRTGLCMLHVCYS